ncbi:MAG: hypothetical protein KFH87_13605 [Bacteroidetes bacterium]|nr:hypothetical protein [Bacteroidota bacterium]
MMPHSNRGHDRIQALVITLSMHVLGLLASFFLLFDDPPEHDTYLRLTFLPPTEVGNVAGKATEKSQPAQQTASSAASRSVSDEPLPPETAEYRQPVQPESPQRPSDADEAMQAITTETDSVRTWSETNLQGVFERDIDPEEAWRQLGALLDEHPEFREMVLREMIAGQGFLSDSLPPVNLHLDQIFKHGIRPTWDTQRGAIEHASRTFDPVQGWTNKGSYGPQINIIGLLKFLMDLIEGE